jgi:hypothetical protein
MHSFHLLPKPQTATTTLGAYCPVIQLSFMQSTWADEAMTHSLIYGVHQFLLMVYQEEKLPGPDLA